MDNEYVDFSFAPYCLLDLLLALENNGIKHFSITKEDNDLHIRIKVDYLKHLRDINNNVNVNEQEGRDLTANMLNHFNGGK